MEKKYNFTYQTKNLITGKLYIGVHSTNKLNDGYIGCGIHRQSSANKNLSSPLIKAVRKYGYENFKLEILDFFNTKANAYEEEEFLVDEEWVNRRDTYNVKLGGNINSCSANTALKRGKHPFAKKVINAETGELYDCAEDLAEMLGIRSGLLTKWLSGSRNNPTVYKYVDEASFKYIKRLKGNIVYTNLKQYTIDGELVSEFKDISEACSELKLNRLSLSNHLRGNRKSYLNYVWTSDHLRDRFSNQNTNIKYTFYLSNGKEVFRFRKKTEILTHLSYSKNSAWRLFMNLAKGQTVRGYYIITEQEYAKNKNR